MSEPVSSNKGFTLIELLISVAIFVVMTILLIAKYGNFDQSVLLTNLAYDVALVVRTAQTYGLSVANSSDSSATADFDFAYGVDFSTTTPLPGDTKYMSGNNKVILFADVGGGVGNNPNGIYDGSAVDSHKNTYVITRGAVVSGLCAGADESSCNTNVSKLDITFKRPNPTAIICDNGSCAYKYAKITITSSDGRNVRSLGVSNNGQVSIIQ